MDHFDPGQYWERRLEDPDLSAAGYQALGLAYNRWLYRLRRKLFLRELRRLRVDWNGRKVLDIGSGTGFYVSEWLRLGASVTASDLTRASVEQLAASFPGCSVIRLDITETPPFLPASFDAISAFDVLFHIVDDSRYHVALMNIASLLKEGGYLLFSENFVHGRTVRTMHQTSRSLCDVEVLLADARLEIVLRRPTFVLMNAPIDSRSRLLRAYWSLLESGLSRFPWLGGIVGAFLYPLEAMLVSVRKESPSTELMICRKLASR